MPLTYTYEQIDIPGWRGIRCLIKSAETNQQFVSLGLEDKQTELSEIQKSWLKQHEEEICMLCNASHETYQNYAKNIKDDDLLNLYRRAIQRQHKLLDQFCKECKIVDS